MHANTLCNPLLIDNTAVCGSFGMMIKSREFVAFDQYRMGYQGSEKDDEISGGGNNYTTEYRILDTRLGRWLSTDPKWNSWETPYSSMGNNPIWFNDPLGDVVDYGKKGTKEYRQNKVSTFFAKIASKDFRSKVKEWDKAKDEDGKDITYHLNRVDGKPTLSSGGELQGMDANNINVKYDGSGPEMERHEINKVISRTKTIEDSNSNNDPNTHILKKVVPGSSIIVSPLPHPDEFTFNDITGTPEFAPFTAVSGVAGESYENKVGFASPVQNTPTVVLTVPSYKDPIRLTLTQRSSTNWNVTDKDGFTSTETKANSHWTVKYEKQLFKIKIVYYTPVR